MYYNDHNPPHFHAEYAGHRALVDIQSASIIQGARTLAAAEAYFGLVRA